jgi:hypothetical protein
MDKYKILIIISLIIIAYLLYKEYNGMENFADEQMSNISAETNSMDMTISEESVQETATQETSSESMNEVAPPIMSEMPVMPEMLVQEKPIIKDKLQTLDGYKLCLGNTCITENDLKSFIKHGDKFTLKTNMNNNRLRITDPAKNNEPRQAWFSNSNRGPWEVMRIEKCGLDGIEDGNKCWAWGAFGKQVEEPNI